MDWWLHVGRSSQGREETPWLHTLLSSAMWHMGLLLRDSEAGMGGDLEEAQEAGTVTGTGGEKEEFL